MLVTLLLAQNLNYISRNVKEGDGYTKSQGQCHTKMSNVKLHQYCPLSNHHAFNEIKNKTAQLLSYLQWFGLVCKPIT